MTAARLLLTKVLPAFGLAPDIIRTLFTASSIAKWRLVLRLLIASMAKSAGFSTANNPYFYDDEFYFLPFPIIFAILYNHSEIGTLAYTLIPFSSNCVGESIPFLNRTRRRIIQPDTKRPVIIPIAIIAIFLRFNGSWFRDCRVNNTHVTNST